LLPSRNRNASCPGCPSAAQPNKPRPAKLTIDGAPIHPPRGAGD
jgi:hypothetical protein